MQQWTLAKKLQCKHEYHHVQQKTMYEASWYSSSLYQLAVLLLCRDPQLSGSSGGLLFPCIIWRTSFYILWFYHCDAHFYSHIRLTVIPERWQADQPTVPKVQMLSTWEVQKFQRGSKYFYTIWTRGTNSTWQISKSPAVLSQSQRRKVIRYKCTLYMYPLPYHFPRSLLWLCGPGIELWQSIHCWSPQPYLTPIISHPSLSC